MGADDTRLVANAEEPALGLRLATEADIGIVFKWRNDPRIANLGVDGAFVSWEEHQHWFDETLRRDKRILLVVEVDGQPAGVVRYDALDTHREAAISLFLLPDFVGRGLGRRAFVASLPYLLKWRTTERIMARVRDDNHRSLKFFHRLGFRKAEDVSSSRLVVLRWTLPRIYHSRPYIGEAEVEAAVSVIRSGQLSGGLLTEQLESRWSEWTASTAAASVGSGLAALRLGLLALGVGDGDEVVVPAYTCTAVLNAILAVGARPVLADVLADNWTLSPDAARRVLTSRTRAVVAVNLFGLSAEWDELITLGVPVIEDCAHGIGGSYRGRPYGSSGIINISSFYATKMITGGGGGIVAGPNAAIIDRVRELREAADRTPCKHALNDRITEVEAAMVIAQLGRLQEILAERARRAETYDSALASLVKKGFIVLPPRVPGRVWYRYAIRLVRHEARAVCRWMKERGVWVEQPVWDLRKYWFWEKGLPVADQAYERVVSLPLYPDLSELEQDMVCSMLQHCLEGF